MKLLSDAKMSVVIGLLVVLLLPVAAVALDKVEEPGKEWETTITLGYTDFKDHTLSNAVYGGIRAQKRVQYPFLVGVGGGGSVIGDVVFGELTLPVSLRASVAGLNLDFLVAPGVGYAKNTNVDVSKVVGTGTAGIEIKRFVKPGTSIGLGAYYEVSTYDKLDHWRLMFTLGF